MTVYLLHFAPPYKHARHYLGSTDDLDARLAAHRSGRGARLTQVAVQNGSHRLRCKTARAWCWLASGQAGGMRSGN